MPGIPSVGRWWQDYQKFEVILSFTDEFQARPGYIRSSKREIQCSHRIKTSPRVASWAAGMTSGYLRQEKKGGHPKSHQCSTAGEEGGLLSVLRKMLATEGAVSYRLPVVVPSDRSSWEADTVHFP